jgi:hypothetical protein
MDHLQTRLDALEQRTHAIERQLRWWRRLAWGLGVLSMLGWTLQAVLAGESPGVSIPDRFAALERKLTAITYDEATREVRITGAKLRLLNGQGATETTNGLGNLLVGYPEPGESPEAPQLGSHNVVVGPPRQFSSFGSLVVGR